MSAVIFAFPVSSQGVACSACILHGRKPVLEPGTVHISLIVLL